MLKFRYRYFILAVTILLIEVFIALFVHDEIIRPHIGDFLVVILIYCFVRSILDLTIWTTAVSVLLFSYIVEILQYLKFVEVLGLQDSKFARIIIGTNFSWIDILAYSLGIGFTLIIEHMISGRQQIKPPEIT